MERAGEVHDFSLLRARAQWARLDVLPFIAIHPLVLYLCIATMPSWQLGALCMGASATLHAVVFLMSTWSVKAKALIQFSTVHSLEKATHVLALPSDVTLKPEVCEIALLSAAEKSASDGSNGVGQKYFLFEHLRYLLSKSDDESSPTTHPCTHGVSCALVSYPTNNTVSQYLGHSGLADDEEARYQVLFGQNDFDIPPATFYELFVQQVTAPLFVFQVFCMVLYTLDEYWYYSIITLAMLIFIERTTALQRQRNLNDIRKMKPPAHKLRVYRSKKWAWCKSDELYPGDLISLTRQRHRDEVVPADCLLLAGTCVVNEAMLTGEATPLRKVPIDDVPPADHAIPLAELADLKRHCVFAGTKVIQTTGASKDRRIRPPDTGCLCYVVRTGFATQEGTLVRTFMASREQATANNKESLTIVFFLLLFALAAAAYLFKKGVENGKPVHKLVIECLLVITSVIPPELPLQLSLAVTNALKAMSVKAINITCIEPFRIPIAGRADVVCFDKTGTLTDDKVQLLGVAESTETTANSNDDNDDFSSLDGRDADGEEDDDDIDDDDHDEGGGDNDDDGDETSSRSRSKSAKSGTRASSEKQRSKKAAQSSLAFSFLSPKSVRSSLKEKVPLIVSATDVVEVDGAQVGDPMDMAILSGLKWRMKKDTIVSAKSKCVVKKLHVFPFNSDLKRMSAVCEVENRVKDSRKGASKSTREFVVVCKGAAEVVKSKLGHVPLDYDEMHKRFAQEGKRVVAVAYKLLSTTPTKSKAARMDRDTAESGLKFLGFIVLGSQLKYDTKKAVSILLKSSHHVVIITGDSPLTACYVASQVKVAEKDTCILSHKQHHDALNGKGKGTAQTQNVPAQQPQDTVDTTASDYIWRIVASNEVIPAALTVEEVRDMATRYDLCVTGDVISDLTEANQLKKFVKFFKVYARTTPHDKSAIVQAYKHMGAATVMCGDGTNDVGALKVADAGLALLSGDVKRPKRKRQDVSVLEQAKMELEAMTQEKALKLGDASIAAAFTSKTSSCISVCQLIRQGRATLVIANQMIQILVLNCLLNSFSLSVLYTRGIRLSDTQMTVSGLATAMAMYYVSASSPMKKLSKERPRASSTTAYMFVSVILQFLLHVGVLLYTLSIASTYDPPSIFVDPDASSKYKPSASNTVIFLLLVSMQATTIFVSYKGQPHIQSLRDNSNLLTIVGLLIGAAFVGASGAFMSINVSFELVVLPTHVSEVLMLAIVGDTLGAFAIDFVVDKLLPQSSPSYA